MNDGGSPDDPAPNTTLAIVLGASSWPKSPDLSASSSFGNSGRGFLDYLVSPRGFALRVENVLDLFDSELPPSEIDSSVGEFLDARLAAMKARGVKAKDLILYYVGHGGFVGSSQEYFLAIKATRQGNEGSSGVRIADLARTVREKGAHLRRYILLDCCFSASAYQAFQSAPLEVARIKTLEMLPKKGTALLCSSGARDPSLAPRGEMYTMFSGALLSTLKEGDLSLGTRLSLADVGRLSRDVIREKYASDSIRPQIHVPDQNEGNIADIPIFPNPAVQLTEVGERLDGINTRLREIESNLSSMRATVDRLDSTSDGKPLPPPPGSSTPVEVRLALYHLERSRLTGPVWLALSLTLMVWAAGMLAMDPTSAMPDQRFSPAKVKMFMPAYAVTSLLVGILIVSSINALVRLRTRVDPLRALGPASLVGLSDQEINLLAARVSAVFFRSIFVRSPFLEVALVMQLIACVFLAFQFETFVRILFHLY